MQILLPSAKEIMNDFELSFLPYFELLSEFNQLITSHCHKFEFLCLYFVYFVA